MTKLGALSKQWSPDVGLQVLPAITVPSGASQLLLRESLVVTVASKYKYTAPSVVRKEVTVGGTMQLVALGACVVTLWLAKLSGPLTLNGTEKSRTPLSYTRACQDPSSLAGRLLMAKLSLKQ
jgi:hypothetical protein